MSGLTILLRNLRHRDGAAIKGSDGLIEASVNLISPKRLFVFCPRARNNKPQELPLKAALGAWFYWALSARLGSSHD